MEPKATTEPTKSLNLPCRYYRVYTDPEVPCREENFKYVERTLPIPVEQAALVLVDVWNMHYIDSWMERAAEMTRDRIVPLLEAAREIGMTVIHGPAPQVAKHYPGNEPPPTAPAPTEAEAARIWPPADFQGTYRAGRWAQFGREPEPLPPGMRDQYVGLDIAEIARPVPGEFVISDGDQMHDLLRERKILHLIYAGFATNWCVMHRHYGVLAMNRRGYNIVVVRDATTGIEWHDTYDTMAATNNTVRDIETLWGWSTDTDAFIQAGKAIKGI